MLKQIFPFSILKVFFYFCTEYMLGFKMILFLYVILSPTDYKNNYISNYVKDYKI
jgi:hypothetical protein